MYILAHEGEITLFRTLEALARYVEAPDLALARAFDSSGRVIELTSAPVRKRFGFVNVPPVSATVTSIVESESLREALRSHLEDRLGLQEDALRAEQLSDLLDRALCMHDYMP